MKGTRSAERARLNQDLIDVAWKNDVKAVRRLIKAGADVNAKDATEQSAFLIAASEGYLDLLVLTLDFGADVAPWTVITARPSFVLRNAVTLTSSAGFCRPRSRSTTSTNLAGPCCSML
ncbi:MAG TPA: ankyrin repeat domain-containing protein [Propionibacteriaceae bacterium]|nr:ankyrin repeat domain-containing protein [Propionibacteriaceae bacterium]